MKAFNKVGRLILAILIIFILGWLIWQAYHTNNLGFNNKTLWDWMELLVIPMVLAVGVWWLDKSEKETERKINIDSHCQQQLNHYLESMTKLLLDKDLRGSESKAEIRIIARVQTLTVLRNLDLSRKAEVIRFLYEADLINKRNPIVDLSSANLSDVNLDDINLSEASLIGVNFCCASLQGTDLSGANLRWANLTSCDLRRCNLSTCELNECILENSDLRNADLSWSSLNGVDLRKAKIAKYQLESVSSHERTMLPKGF